MGIEENVKGYLEQAEDDYEWWCYTGGGYDHLLESFTNLWYWIDVEAKVNEPDLWDLTVDDLSKWAFDNNFRLTFDMIGSNK